MKIKKQELKDKVYNYKTESKYGFSPNEIKELLKDYPNIKMDKFDDALMGVTCMMNEKTHESIIYHCDIYKALLCGLENRNLKLEEWD